MVDTLKLEPLLFPAAFYGGHRMRILVDGVDIVTAAYGPGGFSGEPVAGFAPSYLLGPDGLNASPDAREVDLGGSGTTEDALSVRIQRVDSIVIWDRWRMVEIHKVVKEGPEVGLDTFRFDAQAYASEVANATAQANRTWPARSVAEMLEVELWRDGFDQNGNAWIRTIEAIRAPTDRPETVEITYGARDQPGMRKDVPGWYVISFPIDGTDPADQARTIAHRLGHEDLKPLSVHRPRPRRS